MLYIIYRGTESTYHSIKFNFCINMRIAKLVFSKSQNGQYASVWFLTSRTPLLYQVRPERAKNGSSYCFTIVLEPGSRVGQCTSRKCPPHRIIPRGNCKYLHGRFKPSPFSDGNQLCAVMSTNQDHGYRSKVALKTWYIHPQFLIGTFPRRAVDCNIAPVEPRKISEWIPENKDTQLSTMTRPAHKAIQVIQWKLEQ